MTNEQKIKAYLAAGHYVKVGENVITLIHDNWERLISSDGSKFSYSEFEYYTIEPIPRKPNYKVWDKVVVLDIAREMDWYNDFSDTQKWTVWKFWTITWICPDWTYIINNEAFFPSWSIAPAFDDDKPTKIQELESQLAQIQKELELLKV